MMGNGKPFRLSWRSLLSATLLALSGPGLAESGAYRVEVLVFRYADSTLEPRESSVLRHYPGAWPLFEARQVVYPEDPAPLGIISDQMKAVWRRLENTAGIEPLYQQSWEQSRIDFHPPVRIHDGEIIHERLRLPRFADIDLTVPDFLAPYRDRYFRLDGTAQLRRSRFLHLEFDLEYRLQLLPPANGPQEPALVTDSRQAGLRPPPYWNPPARREGPAPVDPPPGARYFRLRESRQARTGELMYFDTPYLGVIARVTATAGE